MVSEASSRGIGEESTCFRRYQGVAHAASRHQPTFPSTCLSLVGAAGLSNCARASEHDNRCRLALSGPLHPRPSRTRTAILPFLRVDDRRCERIAPLTYHAEGGAPSRGVVCCCCCGLWASHPSPQVVFERACRFVSVGVDCFSVFDCTDPEPPSSTGSSPASRWG